MSKFGEGTGSIWPSSVQCTGDESRLIDCTPSPIDENCTHSHDAAVRCRRGTTPFKS